jgi:hypothetical protein
MAESFNWMESTAAKAAARPLDTQSRGRNLNNKEQEFADALEEIFKSGTHDMNEVALKLSDAGITSPLDGKTDWTNATLQKVLETINASLDEAHQENGYGA